MGDMCMLVRAIGGGTVNEKYSKTIPSSEHNSLFFFPSSSISRPGLSRVLHVNLPDLVVPFLHGHESTLSILRGLEERP